MRPIFHHKDLSELETIVKFICKITEFKPRYNIAPRSKIPVLVSENGQNVLKEMCWGLIPSWAKDETIADKLINARAETLTQKPSFKRPFQKQRCLVPADGYYEWATALGQYRPKQPFYISSAEGTSLSLAGIWSEWVSPTGQVIQSASIITREAVGMLVPIHSRMPVIMPSDRWSAWLDPSRKEIDELRGLMEFSEPARGLTAHAVADTVNSTSNNGPSLTHAITLGEPETLF